MTKAESRKLQILRDRYSPTERFNTRDKAWSNLQDLAEAHGYGSRFCSLESGMDWLMQSQSHAVRMQAMRLYGIYCTAEANVEASIDIERVLCDMNF